jgi:glucose-6-phosphate 1-dehydrogenase
MKTIIVLFGITGDLSRRKLLPSLSNLIKNNEISDIDILGISRRDFDVKELMINCNFQDGKTNFVENCITP